MIAVATGLLLLFPEWLTRDSISAYLGGLGSGALMVYLLMCITRSLLMIPVTPFVLAGAITFPDLLMLVFAISMVGILVGAFLIYSFPAFGGFDRLLEDRYPTKIALLKKNMHGNRSFWIIAGWSFSFGTHRPDLLRSWHGAAPFSESSRTVDGRRDPARYYLCISWLRVW